MRNILVLIIFCIAIKGFSQELNCDIVVNAQQVGNQNLTIFSTLEKQIKEFVNNTKWTNRVYKPQERINCNMVINLNSYNGSEAFQATIQVQSSRPVFGSSYSSPVYNFNDKDFNFTYTEYQSLIFNPNQYESNLVSVLAFHVYMILGLDADTFSEHGGDAYYDQAQTIANYSQQSNFNGWSVEDGLQSRYALIYNILSLTFSEFRTVLYDYHRNGLDQMSVNVKTGKEGVATSIQPFKVMNNRRPNSFLLRVFFDAKSDEIEDIFTGGPSVNIAAVKETLNSIAPMYSSQWKNIKF